MNTEEIRNRIEKKQAEIAKLERLYEKYSAEDLEEKAIIDRFLETGDREEYRAYLKSHNMWYGGDAYHKASELYDARQTLAKYQKQLEATVAKENTLAEIPEVIKTFRDDLENRWNKYDFWKREQIKADYKKLIDEGIESRERYYQMREKWGQGWSEFRYLSDTEIKKQNKAAVDALVLNLVTRTVEIAGTITDAQYLSLDRDNQGYCIINGIVIGEKGKARVESIGAGGYNIQRYHIRVLVKEVRD